MSAFPKIIYIYDRYKKASSTKEATVELRITYDKKQKYISTGIKLLPKQWKNGIIINTPDAQQLNLQLDKLLISVRKILMEMSENGNIDIFSVPEKLGMKEQHRISFSLFLKKRAEIRMYGKSEDTKKRYERFLRFFKEYGKIKSFEDLDEANIIDYDDYLHSKGMKDYSKWHNYHRFLNSFIIDAIDAGYIKKNPYKWLRINKGSETESIHKCLSLEEFREIEKVNLPTKSLEKIRDVFVFQTYTCLSYRDLKNFNLKAIVKIKDMYVYTGNREKTGKNFVIPLQEPALTILKKYDNKLPIISNVKYNQYLKIVAQAAGIDKPVSTHWARHTGATLLLNAGVDLKIVSRICMGHKTKR